ncbi:hypothetical protein BDR07DRAFT_1387448 [Suillus spraguei]|nr:hypothetical protein BDR07DRAFT_1387448 [Suillus spraguei]
MYLFFPPGCILGLIHPAFFVLRIDALWNINTIVLAALLTAFLVNLMHTLSSS